MASPTSSMSPVMAARRTVVFMVFMVRTYAADASTASGLFAGGGPAAHVAARGGGGDDAPAGRALHVGGGAAAVLGRGGGGGTAGCRACLRQVEVERVLGVQLGEPAVGAHARPQLGQQARRAGRRHRHRGRDAAPTRIPGTCAPCASS